MKEEAGAAGEIRVVEEKPRKNLASQQSSLGLPLSPLHKIQPMHFAEAVVQQSTFQNSIFTPQSQDYRKSSLKFWLCILQQITEKTFFIFKPSLNLLKVDICFKICLWETFFCSNRENCRIICEYDAQHPNSDEAFYVMRVGDRMLFSMIPMMNVGVQRGNPAKQQSTCHSTNAQCLHCPLMKCAIFSSPALVRHPSKVCCCCCCSVSCSKSTGCASKLASMPALEQQAEGVHFFFQKTHLIQKISNFFSSFSTTSTWVALRPSPSLAPSLLQLQ